MKCSIYEQSNYYVKGLSIYYVHDIWTFKKYLLITRNHLKKLYIEECVIEIIYGFKQIYIMKKQRARRRERESKL